MVLAAALGVFAGWWKGRLVVRSDARVDQKGETIHGSFEELIAVLREEVRALRADLREAESRCSRAEEGLRAAQIANAHLNVKVIELEQRCERIAAK